MPCQLALLCLIEMVPFPQSKVTPGQSSFLNRVRILFDSLMTKPEAHKSPFTGLDRLNILHNENTGPPILDQRP